MPRLLARPDQLRYPRGHLFGPWESPRMFAERRPPPKAKRLRVSSYGGSQGRGDAEQQVRTVREVLLARLDDLGATSLWPIGEDCGLSWDAWIQMYQRMLLSLFPEECGDGETYIPDPAETVKESPGLKWRVVRVIETVEEEVERDGKTVTVKREVEVVKTMAEKVLIPVHRRRGLFPYPCEGVGDARSVEFARHLLRGQGSPVAEMTTGEGDDCRPLFTDAELARLGERQERRER